MNKPAFNPNRPFEVANQVKPKFDPSQNFQAAQDDNSFSSETALRSYGNALMMGYGDNIRAATEPVMFSVLNAITGNDVESDPDYVARRDEEIKRTRQLQKENPFSSKVGTVAGALNSIVLPAANIGKGATIGTRVANAAVTGGAFGFLQNPGEKEGEFSDLQLSDRLKSGAIGTGLGVGLQGAGEGVAALLKSAPTVQKFANRMGARSIGAERGTIKKLGEDEVQDVGKYAIDNLLSPMASTDDMIARNAAKQAEGGGMMDKVYSAIDDAGVSTFNPLDAAASVDEKIGGFYRSPINKGETNQLENTLESILMRGNGDIPIKEAQALKQELGKVANWKNNVVVFEKEKMAREAYGIISRHIDDAVEKGAQEIGTTGLLDTLRQGKDLYSKSKSAELLLDNKIAREQGNKLFGLTDSIATAGGVAGAGPSGIAAYPIKKTLEKYGTQNVAIAADKIASFLTKTSPKMAEIAQTQPKLFVNIVQNLARNPSFQPAPPGEKMKPNFDFNRNAEQQQPLEVKKQVPDKGKILEKTKNSKYGQVLQNAANRGDDAFNAAHFVLSQRDPAYRTQLDEGPE